MPRHLLATTSIASALILAAAAPGWAQTATPPVEVPSTAPVAPTAAPAAPIIETDRTFVEEAARGGMAEVELGRLAQEKASDQEVKDLAGLIVTEHDQANQQLMAIAQGKGAQVPQGLDAEHQQMRDSLQGMSGAEFDRMYIDGQVRDHDVAVALFERQSQSGQDPDLKRFASETLPKIQAHTDSLKQVAQRLGGAPATQAVTAAAPAATAAGGGMTGATEGGGMRAEDIVAMTAYASSGERMGEVEDVVIDPATGRVTAALVEFGGFLGLGTKKVAVDWSDLQVDPAGERIVVVLTREELEGAPEYFDADDPRPAAVGAGTTTGAGGAAAPR